MFCGPQGSGKTVALRKESVDRNSTYVIRLPRCQVALRKESVDRNKRLGLPGWLRVLSLSARRAWIEMANFCRNRFCPTVALRKESVDRNLPCGLLSMLTSSVALRKESVDRNTNPGSTTLTFPGVALRKESVDRNRPVVGCLLIVGGSLSARRAWIEMPNLC